MTSATAPDAETVAAELRALEARLDQARVAGDMSVFEAVLGPGFRTTSPVGAIADRDQSLKDFATRTMNVTRSESKDIVVRPFGNVAIITGVADMDVSVRGLGVSGEYAYTHVYMKSEAGWQVVAAHSSRRMPDWLYVLAVKIGRLFGA